MDAAAQAILDNCAVAVIAYDLPYPNATLARVRPITGIFGVALVLTPERTGKTLAQVDLAIEAGRDSTMPDQALEELRTGNPAARSLPLLAAIAAKESKTVWLDYLSGNSLAVAVAC